MSMPTLKLNQEFWCITQPMLFKPMVVKPWQGVVTHIYEATKTHIRLSPRDAEGKPDRDSVASAVVPVEGLYVSALDAWAAYLDELERIQLEMDEQFTHMDENLAEAKHVITELMKNENRICHLSLDARGRLRSHSRMDTGS